MRGYPKIGQAMENRHEVYNNTIDELHKLAKEGDTFVLAPSVDLGIKRTETDPAELQRVYDIGIKDANDNLEEMREFLGKYREVSLQLPRIINSKKNTESSRCQAPTGWHQREGDKHEIK